jgi:hypothetical protein
MISKSISLRYSYLLLYMLHWYTANSAQLIEALPIKTNLNNLSLSSTQQTSQQESLIIKHNHKHTLRIGQRLIRRYKMLLRDTSTLDEGKLQVCSKAFHFIRKSRRGRTYELKALISFFFTTMDLEVKPKGWIKVLLQGITNLAAKFGMKEVSMKGKSMWPRKMVNKIVTDIKEMEQSPSSKEQEEANKNLFNKELGTWGSWSEPEVEVVQEVWSCRKTRKSVLC